MGPEHASFSISTIAKSKQDTTTPTMAEGVDAPLTGEFDVGPAAASGDLVTGATHPPTRTALLIPGSVVAGQPATPKRTAPLALRGSPVPSRDRARGLHQASSPKPKPKKHNGGGGGAQQHQEENLDNNKTHNLDGAPLCGGFQTGKCTEADDKGMCKETPTHSHQCVGCLRPKHRYNKCFGNPKADNSKVGHERAPNGRGNVKGKRQW